jgi:hypothetical protein
VGHPGRTAPGDRDLDRADLSPPPKATRLGQAHPDRVRIAPHTRRNRGLISTPRESTEVGAVPSATTQLYVAQNPLHAASVLRGRPNHHQFRESMPVSPNVALAHSGRRPSNSATATAAGAVSPRIGRICGFLGGIWAAHLPKDRQCWVYGTV